MKTRAEGEGVRSLLIMCDSEGYLGDVDTAKRTQAVENHYKWVEAAQYLGCHSIRVNAFSEGTFLEQQERAADGLRRLCEFANPYGINVIVENHGGLSSNGAWLVGVMRLVNHPRVGILPDFGNFCIRREGGHPWEGACVEEYDRYQGVHEMMPYARAVSAKSNNFDAAGNCVETDYPRIMKVVLEAGYRGFVGIEYEGDELDEPGGIRATRDLLLRIREQMS
jgi:sugar phosphate isomerase/epimerase